ncbi:MAG: hypothetical protein EXR43_04045 [Dehalococcoidia bacterium]|nr:hypothetical protein [Dehalococcoidia bacterium]
MRIHSRLSLLAAVLGLLPVPAVVALVALNRDPGEGPSRLVVPVILAAPYLLVLASAFAPLPLTRTVLLAGAAPATVVLVLAVFSVGPFFLPGMSLTLSAAARALLRQGWTSRADALLPAGATLGGALMLGALFALHLRDDPRCWETATASGCTSDIVTAREGLLAAGVTTVGTLIIAGSAVATRTAPPAAPTPAVAPPPATPPRLPAPHTARRRSRRR